MSPRSLLQAEQTQLSAFPYRSAVPALWSFLWPSSGPAPTGPCLSCAGGSRAGCKTPAGVSQVQSRGVESPPSTCWPHCFWCSPGCDWLSELRVYIASSCPILHTPISSSPSLQCCSQSFISQFTLILGIAQYLLQTKADPLEEGELTPLLRVTAQA